MKYTIVLLSIAAIIPILHAAIYLLSLPTIYEYRLFVEKINRRLYSKDKSICVMLTTVGRHELNFMLTSLTNQLKDIDYLNIYVDGKIYEKKVNDIVDAYRDKFTCKVTVVVNEENLGWWGHSLRNKYQHDLPGDYILHADDDDAYLLDAFKSIRTVINRQSNPNKILFFKIRIGDYTIWKYPFLIKNQIGTPNGAIPNQPELFGEWGEFYGGDYHYYKTCKFKRKFINKIIYKVNTKDNNYLKDRYVVDEGVLTKNQW